MTVMPNAQPPGGGNAPDTSGMDPSSGKCAVSSRAHTTSKVAPPGPSVIASMGPSFATTAWPSGV